MNKDEALQIIRSNFPTGRNQLCEVLETLIPELKESDDEKIKNEIIDYLKGFIPHHNDDLVAKSKLWIAWLEKQGEQPNKVSIWKHWKDGIAGNGEGKLTYLIKIGNTYNLTSCLGFECDYIELSELDKLCVKKQGEQSKQHLYDIIIALWDLLDKIDTFSDLQIDDTNPDNPFRKIEDITQERHKFVKSDGYNLYIKGEQITDFKQDEQKPTDKVEPKFKIGDWITIDNPCQIISIDGNYIVQYCDDETTREISKKFCESQFHTWTIQDAKDGDIIANGDMVLIFKCLEEPSYRQHIIAHIGLDINGNIQVTNESWNLGLDWAKPATKEQRDLLFSKMKEAGYEWDSEKKELNEIKQETELPKGEDYGIDSLYHAARILEKTIGDVEGYQSDDGILEHKCAIEAVNRLYKQKPAKWSEEDENLYTRCMSAIQTRFNDGLFTTNEYRQTSLWLKSLKDRVQS